MPPGVAPLPSMAQARVLESLKGTQKGQVLTLFFHNRPACAGVWCAPGDECIVFLVHRKDGGLLNAVFCDVFEIQDAKIRRLTSYLTEVKEE